MSVQIVNDLPKRHIGRNIEKIRDYLGIKQTALASDTGFSQQEISMFEHQEDVDEDTLSKIAKGLGVTSEMIKNFDAERIIYQINHVTEKAFEQGSTAIFQQFNPIEKIVELYERLLKSEREKIEILEGIKKNRSI